MSKKRRLPLFENFRKVNESEDLEFELTIEGEETQNIEKKLTDGGYGVVELTGSVGGHDYSMTARLYKTSNPEYENIMKEALGAYNSMDFRNQPGEDVYLGIEDIMDQYYLILDPDVRYDRMTMTMHSSEEETYAIFNMHLA